jgi:MFS family permease
MASDVKLFGMPAESGRWVLVVVGMVIQLCLGAVYAYGALRGSIEAYFKAPPLSLTPTPMDMTWPFIVFLALFAITMPIAGPYIQKMGPRKVGMVGGALCGLGWIAASFSTSPTMLIPLYGIIGGLGVGIAYGCPIATSAQWFPDKRGLAVGTTVLGFGLSSAIISYSTKYMLGINLGIMDILKIFGVVFLIVSVVLSMFLAFPPAGWKPAGWAPPAPKPGAAVKADFMRDEMTKTGTFKGLWLCYTIGALAGLTAIGIAGPVGTEVYTAIKAAEMSLPATDPAVAKAVKDLIFLLIVPFAVVNGVARPVFGTLTDKLGTKNTAILTFVLIFLACILMYTNYTSGNAYVACFAILWACLGGWLAIAPTATASYFGLKDNAKNYGLVFTAYGAGAVIGGIVSAQAKMLLGGYKPFFLIVAVLALLGIVVAAMMMKPPVKKTG